MMVSAMTTYLMIVCARVSCTAWGGGGSAKREHGAAEGVGGLKGKEGRRKGRERGRTVAVGVDSAGAEVDGRELLRERGERGDEEHPHLHPARREDRRRDYT